MIFISGYRGISAPARGVPPPPHFCTDLVVCRAVALTCSHSLLSDAATQWFLPLVKYLIAEVLPLLLMELPRPEAGPSCSWLELSVFYMGATLASSPIIHLCSTPLRKLYLANTMPAVRMFSECTSKHSL